MPLASAERQSSGEKECRRPAATPSTVRANSTPRTSGEMVRRNPPLSQVSRAVTSAAGRQLISSLDLSTLSEMPTCRLPNESGAAVDGGREGIDSAVARTGVEGMVAEGV